jgi:hypothetical protein
MTRTRIFVAVTTAAVGLTLTACGGVDREGTRDELISQLEAEGVEIDGDCVDTALDKYTDDELTEIDDALADSESTPESDALFAELIACIPAGG